MTKELTNKQRTHVDGPNPGELGRMEYLADRFNRAIDLCHNRKDTQVYLALDVAEELQQMLNDGLRTAKQIEQRGY